MPTIDLYNSDISDFEKNKYLIQVNALREYMNSSETLSSAEITFLKNNFAQLISLVPYWAEEIPSFSLPFERLVINQDVCGQNIRLNSLENLRYPPLKIADKIDFNRASMKGTCIFYAGNGPLPTTIEVQPKIGQIISSSKWKFNQKRPLKLVTICFSAQTAIRNPDELMAHYNIFNRCLMQMQPNNREVVNAVTKLIEDAFTRTVLPINRKGYVMSSLISDYFFNHREQPVDAIYYPSVPNKGSAMNIAIKPEVVDELFDMIEASESVVFSDPSNGAGGWYAFGTANCKDYNKESLELKWVRSPIPMNHPIHDIIKMYCVKL